DRPGADPHPDRRHVDRLRQPHAGDVLRPQPRPLDPRFDRLPVGRAGGRRGRRPPAARRGAGPGHRRHGYRQAGRRPAQAVAPRHRPAAHDDVVCRPVHQARRRPVERGGRPGAAGDRHAAARHRVTRGHARRLGAGAGDGLARPDRRGHPGAPRPHRAPGRGRGRGLAQPDRAGL
ncbi:MAG: hypothetical protein AVDCRST_MAG52-1695, partial [uncultured Blastococcus sp.]